MFTLAQNQNQLPFTQNCLLTGYHFEKSSTCTPIISQKVSLYRLALPRHQMEDCMVLKTGFL